jgi:phosphatidate cytidylyltransferase
MLKQRLLTALILGGATLWAIFGLDTAQLAVLFGAAVLAAAWEWGRLAGMVSPLARAAYVLFVTALLAAAWWAMSDPALVSIILHGALVGWFAAAVWILVAPQAGAASTAGMRVLKGVAGVLALVPAWLAMLLLHGSAGHGPGWVLFLLGLIWVADSGAYFAGRRWGRRKLAPRVSPGKTWAGVYGAFILVLVYALAAASLLGLPMERWVLFVGLSVAMVPVSVVGDLFESLLKRQAGLKDSSHLLPGHGGILDRIDSLTAAAPLFMLGLTWLGMRA